MCRCGYFFRINNYNNLKQLKLPNNHAKGKNLHYVGLSDEDATVKLFVDALAKRSKDDAKVYISKNFAKDLDLEELSRTLAESRYYKSLVKVEFNVKPKNCRTNSIMLLKNRSIIHLHLIKEPDNFSNWKIYGIEKE